MSIGSPSVPYHISMQSQQQPPRPESPSNNNILPNHIKSPPHSSDPYGAGMQSTSTSHPMYNSMNNVHIPPSDYAPLSSMESDASNFHTKVNGFGAAPFRTTTSFNPFPTRPRHNTAPYRETTSSFGPSSYTPTSADMFSVQNVPAQQSSFYNQPEGLHHPGRAHDYSNVGPPSAISNGIPQSRHSFSVDPSRHSLDSTLIHSQVNQQGPMANGMGLHQSGPQQSFQGPFVNGNPHGLSHGHHGALPAQAQFGPSLGANTPGSGPGAVGQGSSLTGASSLNHVNGIAQNQQEEISTIFVVGFPEDMQEREFQNMFMFSSGFEAATLKIPNKEYTAYGSAGVPTGPNARLQYPGANDPYNIVTVNQGGVVVDGGRDGPTTSWPAAAPIQDEGHFISTNLPVQPPRKQIIGFAKFRTRQEALEARDLLQGRRVDAERGAVLKAEMAKKNLHTKRGVPGVPSGLPIGSLMNGVGGGVPESFANVAGLNGLTGMGSNGGAGGGGEAPLAQRERELGALGATFVGLGPRRERLLDSREEDERERRRGDVGAVGPTGLGVGSRGARERAEEDERERERKRKEKEAARLRQNSYMFEAFHSVPQQMVRQGANSLLSAENGSLPNGMTLPSPPAMHNLGSQNESNGAGTSPWGNLRDVGASAALRKMSIPVLSSNLPPRPASPASLSPPANFDAASGLSSAPLSASSQSGSGLLGNRSAPFSPQSNTSSLPSHPSLPSRPRPYSPSNEQQHAQQAGLPQSLGGSSMPASSASSVSGSQSGNDDELSRSMAALAVSPTQGTTSPQLPSPASGASSGTGRNPGDQNPPINTLYVGNLPTAPAASGMPLNLLEDRLRDLFSRRPGYRKLCFKQKTNGPMCFVEFENVGYATKALNDLNGHTLDGLVKGGGIRLSYSKNPLGVRTPTSAKDSSMQQQQSLALGQSIMDAFAPRQGEIDAGRGRRDTGMASPTSSYHYTMSPPPPRFISPPPSGPFTASFSGPTVFPRANPQGFGMAAGSSNSFYPFGISPSHSTIPDQPSADASNDPISHSLTSTTPPNIEASRAG